MRAVWMRARNELRLGWRGVVAVAIVCGAFAGGALGAFAGARRTATAVDRFLAYAGTSDGDVEADPAAFGAIEALPEVLSAQRAAYMFAGAVKPDGSPLLQPGQVSGLAIAGTRRGRGPIIVAGRLPDQSRSDEVMIDEEAADLLHARIGSTYPIAGFAPSDVQKLLNGGEVARTIRAGTVTVTAIVRGPIDIVRRASLGDVTYLGSAEMYFTYAWYQRYHGTIGGFAGVSVRLKPGQTDAFIRDLHRVAGPGATYHRGTDDLVAASKARRATGIQSFVVLLFGMIATLAFALVAGQALSRLAFGQSHDYASLRALGMSRSDLLAVSLLRNAAVALGAAVVAVPVAYAISAGMPAGLARRAEIHPGLSFDGAILGGGAAAFVVLVVLCGIPAMYRAARAARGGAEVARRSRLAEVLARRGARPTIVSGVRLAFESGSGRSAVATRSTIIGTAVAIAAFTTTLVFGSSLGAIATADNPGAFGWRWSVAVGNPHGELDRTDAERRLRSNPNVTGFTAEALLEFRIDDRDELGIALDPVVGAVGPPAIDGRVPRAPDEIALGRRSLRALHKTIGDRVDVSERSGTGRTAMRIVGVVVIPPSIINDQVELGMGAMMTMAGAERIAPRDLVVSQYLVDTRPGGPAVKDPVVARAYPGASIAARDPQLVRDFPGSVLPVIVPDELQDLQGVGAQQTLLSDLLLLVAIASIAHMLITSVRRRARDIAVLKTLGFVRRQVRSTIAWQASATVVVALAIGVPLGFAAGRWSWLAYVDHIGLGVGAETPWLSLGVPTVVLGLVAVNLIASMPARTAARTSPARVLRAAD